MLPDLWLPGSAQLFSGSMGSTLPTSPVCNAACIGCISLQPSGCCPATQDRIQFVPRADEIAEIAVPHLKNAIKPIVSFGQGCEGEPLLSSRNNRKIDRTISESATDKGTINLNTNASIPGNVDRLIKAGLDSIRVSMNSARQDFKVLPAQRIFFSRGQRIYLDREGSRPSCFPQLFCPTRFH